MCHAGGNWGEPSAVVKFWAGGKVEGEESISLNSNCGFLLFPNFWLPKKKKAGFSFETSGSHLPLHPARARARARAHARSLSLWWSAPLPETLQGLWLPPGPAPPPPHHPM